MVIIAMTELFEGSLLIFFIVDTQSQYLLLGFVQRCTTVKYHSDKFHKGFFLCRKVHTIISADYFEFFAYAMHRLAGTEFLVMLANGTQGNINNCDFTKPARTSRTNFQQAERVANVCAGEA